MKAKALVPALCCLPHDYENSHSPKNICKHLPAEIHHPPLTATSCSAGRCTVIPWQVSSPGASAAALAAPPESTPSPPTAASGQLLLPPCRHMPHSQHAQSLTGCPGAELAATSPTSHPLAVGGLQPQPAPGSAALDEPTLSEGAAAFQCVEAAGARTPAAPDEPRHMAPALPTLHTTCHLPAAELAADDTMQAQTLAPQPKALALPPPQLSLTDPAPPEDSSTFFTYLQEPSPSGSFTASLTQTQPAAPGSAWLCSSTDVLRRSQTTLGILHAACATVPGSFGSTRALQQGRRPGCLVGCASSVNARPRPTPRPSTSPRPGPTAPESSNSGLSLGLDALRARAGGSWCAAGAAYSRAASSTSSMAVPWLSMHELKQALRSQQGTGDTRLPASAAARVTGHVQRRVSDLETVATFVQLCTGGSSSPFGDARDYLRQLRAPPLPLQRQLEARRGAMVAHVQERAGREGGAGSAGSSCQATLPSTPSVPHPAPQLPHAGAASL